MVKYLQMSYHNLCCCIGLWKYMLSSPVLLSRTGLRNSRVCRIAAAGIHRMQRDVGGSSPKQKLTFPSIGGCNIPDYINI